MSAQLSQVFVNVFRDDNVQVQPSTIRVRLLISSFTQLQTSPVLQSQISVGHPRQPPFPSSDVLVRKSKPYFRVLYTEHKHNSSVTGASACRHRSGHFVHSSRHQRMDPSNSSPLTGDAPLIQLSQVEASVQTPQLSIHFSQMNVFPEITL